MVGAFVQGWCIGNKRRISVHMRVSYCVIEGSAAGEMMRMRMRFVAYLTFLCVSDFVRMMGSDGIIASFIL